MEDTFPEGSAPDAPKHPDASVGTGTAPPGLPPLRPPGSNEPPEGGTPPADGNGAGTGTLTGSTQAPPAAPGPVLPPIRTPGSAPAHPVEPPPAPPATEPAAPREPNRRGLWAIVWTVTAVIAVVAVVVVAVALGRSDSGNEPTPPSTAQPGGNGTSLQFAFPPGTAVYVVDRTSTGYLAFGKHRRPFNVQVSEVRNETPDDVNGTLGLDVESSAWGTENGQVLQGSPFVVAPVVVRPDGEITSGGDIPYLFAFPGYEAGTPGTDIFLPAVPDRPLFPGEVWTTKYRRTYDTAGGGSILYTAQNKFLGFNTKGGVRQARLVTAGKMDVDVEVSVRDFMKLAPGALPDGQFSPGANPAVAFKGTIEYTITSLINVQTHVLDRADATGRMHIAITEPPRNLESKQVHLTLEGATHVLAIRALNPQATPSPGGTTGVTGPTGPAGVSGPSGTSLSGPTG